MFLWVSLPLILLGLLSLSVSVPLSLIVVNALVSKWFDDDNACNRDFVSFFNLSAEIFFTLFISLEIMLFLSNDAFLTSFIWDLVLLSFLILSISLFSFIMASSLEYSFPFRRTTSLL